MPREKGQQFPSDHRRYFRVLEDILDNPKLANASPDVFRFYIRLLALLNRTKSKNGEIILTRQSLNFCACREQRRHALTVACAGAEAGLFTMTETGMEVVISVPKWAKHQGFAPVAAQRDPSAAPAPNPVPNPVPNQREEKGEKSPPTRAPRVASSSKKIPKPEKFEGPDLERIYTWSKGKRFGEHVLRAGLELFREWAPLKTPLRTPEQWVSSFMRITRESVADGKIPTAPPSQVGGSTHGHVSTPAQIAANERVKQARLENECEAKELAAGDDNPEAVGEVIDRSIAAASNHLAHKETPNGQP